MRRFFLELHRRNPVLSVTGWLHVVLLACASIVAPFDSRTVLGIDPWLKPMKFMASIAIFVWTVGWLLHYVRTRHRAWQIVTYGTALTMVTEILCIVLQASRGKTSHFNVATAFDGTVFGVMGVTIAISTVFMCVLLWLFFSTSTGLEAPFLWGIRLGLVVFLLGSAIGGQMVRRMGHTVGGADGGPGLPFVNWSTGAGDLRIAHAAGLHALQILPFVGFRVARSRRPAVHRAQCAIVVAASIGYGALTLLLYLQAMRGIPLVSIGVGA